MRAETAVVPEEGLGDDVTDSDRRAAGDMNNSIARARCMCERSMRDSVVWVTANMAVMVGSERRWSWRWSEMKRQNQAGCYQRFESDAEAGCIGERRKMVVAHTGHVKKNWAAFDDDATTKHHDDRRPVISTKLSCHILSCLTIKWRSVCRCNACCRNCQELGPEVESRWDD